MVARVRICQLSYLQSGYANLILEEDVRRAGCEAAQHAFQLVAAVRHDDAIAYVVRSGGR